MHFSVLAECSKEEGKGRYSLGGVDFPAKENGVTIHSNVWIVILGTVIPRVLQVP